MATQVNQLQPIEACLTPNEAEFFRKNAPHFLQALKLQQTVINQLVVRVGGSGPGTGVVDLGELTEDVAELSDQVEASESWLGGVAAAAYKRYEFPDFSQHDAMLASIGRVRSEVARIAHQVNEIESSRMMLGQILANQRAMKQKIDELEALWASSLAR
jgi:hypothetical protein